MKIVFFFASRLHVGSARRKTWRKLIKEQSISRHGGCAKSLLEFTFCLNPLVISGGILEGASASVYQIYEKKDLATEGSSEVAGAIVEA